MKKHILGIAIFSLIIGVSVFVYGFFVYNTKMKSKVSAISEYKENVSEQPTISQASLNFKLKKLDIKFEHENFDKPIRLHIYKNDAKNISYLNTFYIRNSSDLYNLTKLTDYYYGWLFNESENNNYYVIAEYESNSTFFENKPPMFREHKAHSVLVIKKNILAK